LLAVTGTLKGYDQLLNLVLDEAVEFVRGISYLTYIYCIDLVRLQFSSGRYIEILIRGTVRLLNHVMLVI